MSERTLKESLPKEPRINLRLMLTIAVVTVLPMTAAFFLVDKAVATSLNLGFNPEIVRILETNSRNLRKLGRLDPEHSAEYRAEFEAVESMREIYDAPERIKSSVNNSLLLYFAFGVAAALAFSVAMAILLSRRISSSYRVTFDALIRQREHSRYLEEMTNWQEMAKVLAHEIKNPLTPIQVLVSTLVKAYRENSAAEFEAQLSRSETLIMEELKHLNSTVSKFSDFAKLPRVQTTPVDVANWLSVQLPLLAAGANGAAIALEVAARMEGVHADLDEALFRRVLANIVRNGVEANEHRVVQFVVAVQPTTNSVVITIRNDGALVDPALKKKMFDPYVTTNSTRDNMGLGLAIAKKVVVEHGGEIAYREINSCPAFELTLPRSVSGAVA